MISIVCWLWRGEDPRRQFTAAHVNALHRMIRRHLSVPQRFICIADDTDGLDADIEAMETPPAAVELAQYRNPEGSRFPSCYRRLWTWSEEARCLGERVLLTDIDLVAVRDFAPLLERSEDFVGWRPRMKWGRIERVAGGMYLLRTGSRTDVWTRFRGAESIAEARKAGYRGSDQAWISYCLGPRAPVWPEGSGLYSIRDLADGARPLPPDARLVQFNGPRKPWDSTLTWVREHWHGESRSTGALACA